ncbi:alpha/beta hydrolase family protein [Streptomyces zagrosensis]|uniref:AB hydrolase-1 domain-containing protein n=1 Tax=Streptomyces zagrosensis TaxID=1042984 RepID=A0A7W9UYX0_9ACTN|nr:alpha/beta fold hydrolase [Streptomyces zagrosensis]MBB5935806.1 hypothetical protein [Streptomyces zagrosensis]
MTRHHAPTSPGSTSLLRARRGGPVAATAAALLAAICTAPALASSPTATTATAGTTATVDRAATARTTATASTAHGDNVRGELLSVTPLLRLSRDEVTEAIAEHGVDASSIRHGIATYRLAYATITPTGEPTTASTLLVLPDGGRRHLATVAELHGTTVFRGDAPSTGDNVTRLGAYLYAAGGRAVVAPDYLGLGTGPGTHPYLDNVSSVSASLDALRAARPATAQLGRRLTGEVHVTGFSQGGQVAMAFGREVSRGADRHFRLRSLTPVSGPYDIAGEEVPGMFDGRVKDTSSIFYIAYFLTAQNKLHPLYDDPREVFRQPYADRVEKLFDSEHTQEEVARGLAPNLKELLTDAWYKHVRQPTGTLAEVMALNDGVCQWKPRVPVRLHTATGDRDVPIGNTTSCVKTLAQHGVHPKVINHGDVNHLGGYLNAISDNARWFARHR